MEQKFSISEKLQILENFIISDSWTL